MVIYLQIPRWKNIFCQLLNANGINDVMQKETHTAEQLVPESSFFESETVIK
jgi:hypothetical protein